MSRTVVCSGLLLWGLSPGPLRADPSPAVQAALRHINDVRDGGKGADPVPLQPTAVQLRSAEVQLTEIPVKDAWQVSATYELANPGAAPVALALQVGAFQDLGARFGDRLIETTAGHLYQLSVPPGRPTPLSLEYLFDRSAGSQFWGVRFLSSAPRWGGPSEHVRYVVELKQPTPYVIYPRAFKLAEFTEQANERGAGSITRMVFTADWVRGHGDGDFLAIFPADAVAGSTSAGYCTGFRGDLPNEELAQALARYSRDLLRACRDLVLALHGGRHEGAPPKLPAWADPRTFTLTSRPESPDSQRTLLGPGERAYLHDLEEAERRRPR